MTFSFVLQVALFAFFFLLSVSFFEDFPR